MEGRDADYRCGLTYATTDGCDAERRDGRDCREDFAARRRCGARVLLDSGGTDSRGDRSHRFDAVVPGVDGGVGDRLAASRRSAERRTALQSLYGHLAVRPRDSSGCGAATETFLGEPKRFV